MGKAQIAIETTLGSPLTRTGRRHRRGGKTKAQGQLTQHSAGIGDVGVSSSGVRLAEQVNGLMTPGALVKKALSMSNFSLETFRNHFSVHATRIVRMCPSDWVEKISSAPSRKRGGYCTLAVSYSKLHGDKLCASNMFCLRHGFFLPQGMHFWFMSYFFEGMVHSTH